VPEVAVLPAPMVEQPSEVDQVMNELIASGKKYPKEFRKNLIFRYQLLLKAANNPKKQKDILDICSSDILFWVNVFVQTYNPRKNPSTIPFITYAYEDELIKDLQDRILNQKDLLIDKSRDMGVTWCVVLVITWFWQFAGEGFDFLVGSRKEQYIDQLGNMDTLMEKIRFIIRNQPVWMRPHGWNQERHSNYLKIVNPVSGATITGEATNNNFSRGGRRRAIFFDEFAFWECDQSAWRASADSTNCRIVVSTPNGMNNQFAKLRFSNSIDTKTLHWRLHPEKDQAWYENECKRRNNDAVEIARELDIDYEGSAEGILFKFDDLRRATKAQPIMSMDRKIVAIDPAGEGDDEAVIYVSNNGNIVERKFFRKSDSMQLAGECVSLVRKYSAQVLIGDAIGNDVLVFAKSLLGADACKVVAVKGSEKASDPVRFYNKRAEVYHNAAKLMASGNVQVDDDHTLLTQLNATKYTTKDGRIILIPKEDIKVAVGSSPDRADAWVLAVEGLKYTHSRIEVEQRDRMRQRREPLTVMSGQEYGDWGDIL
jgi:phage terminase large subunit